MKEIPRFKSEDKERDFWASNSPLDYFSVEKSLEVTMGRLEVNESPTKNLFWAIACLVTGAFFLFFAVFYGSLNTLGLGLAGCFVLGSILFFWPAFRPAKRLVIDHEGIWTYIHQTKIHWKDVKEIGIESDMLVLKIRNIEQYYPNSSKMSKAMLKRTVVDLSRMDTDISTIDNFIRNSQHTEPS